MRPIFDLAVFTRDRHPADHCSFTTQGGTWPSHCVTGGDGYQVNSRLPTPKRSLFIDKGTRADRDAYSGFDETNLLEELQRRRIQRCIVGGLATDYCVKATVLDARAANLEVWVLTDAIAAVNVRSGDGDRAVLAMRDAEATLTDSGQIVMILRSHRIPTALVVVDVQNDFCAGGALAVPNAERIFGPMQRLLERVES